MKSYSIFIAVALLLLGCTKEHAPRWIVMKVKVLDYYTGLPVSCTANISWKKKHQFGQYNSNEKSSSEGISINDQGIIVKHHDKGNELAHKLNIYLLDGNYNIYSIPGANYSIAVEPNADKDHVLYVRPYYKFNVRLINTNCTGQTDSLFISSNEISPKKFVGCIDTLLTSSTSYYYTYTTASSTNINIVSKKNGISTDLSQNFSLTFGEITELLIEY